MEDVSGSSGSGEGLCVDVMLMDLIEENLGGIGVVNGLNLIGQDLLASGWEVGMKVTISVHNARGWRRCKFGEKSGCQ